MSSHDLILGVTYFFAIDTYSLCTLPFHLFLVNPFLLQQILSRKLCNLFYLAQPGSTEGCTEIIAIIFEFAFSIKAAKINMYLLTWTCSGDPVHVQQYKIE